MATAERSSARFLRGTMALLAILVALYAIQAALMTGARSPFVADLFGAKPVRSFGHLFFGGLALAFGGLQFFNRIRENRPAVHRWFGRIYVATVLVSGASALGLALVSSGGLTGHWGFGLLGVLWLGTTITAFGFISRGNVASHRRWMVRSYALCLAAVTLRIYLPISLASGLPFEEVYPVIAFMCWVPNIIIAEWWVLPRLKPIS